MSVSAPSRMVKARAVSRPHTPVRLPSSAKDSARTGMPKPTRSHRRTTRVSGALMLSLFAA